MSAFTPRPKRVEAPAESQLVTFVAADTLFAVGIDVVQELVAYNGFEAVPEGSSFSPGAFNLRGRIIPAMDLRLRLGIEARKYDRYTVIVVIRLAGTVFGLVVDRVQDVITVPDSQFQAPPEAAFGGGLGHIRAVIRREEGLIFVLDAEQLSDPAVATGWPSAEGL